MPKTEDGFTETLINELLDTIEGEGVETVLKSLITVLGVVAVTYKIPRDSLLQNVGKVYDARKTQGLLGG